jgi:N-acetylmuramoyl-L-alanine amidase
MSKIFLDPGHGGKDGGAQGNGLSEKELTLQIAKGIKKILETEYNGAEVVMTRDDDRFLELSERADLANRAGAKVFVSIHINSASGTRGDGFETFIYNGKIGESTQAFQNILHRAVLQQTPFFDDRGKKRANYAVLRQSLMPAILTENGFINNPSDASKLKESANLQKISRGHAVGIAEFVGLKKKVNNSARPGAPLYKVQVGAFNEKANATKLVNELIKKGYKPIIVEA